MSITPVASTINSCIKIQPKVSAKLDSGATKHFFKKEHLQFLKKCPKNIKRTVGSPSKWNCSKGNT